MKYYLLIALMLTSCTVSYDPATGAKSVIVDPVAMSQIINAGVAKMNERINSTK